MFIVICVIPSDYQSPSFIDYDRVLLRRVTNDHRAVDTPPASLISSKSNCKVAVAVSFVLFFLSPLQHSWVLSADPLVPKEVARWATDKRIAMGRWTLR